MRCLEQTNKNSLSRILINFLIKFRFFSAETVVLLMKPLKKTIKKKRKLNTEKSHSLVEESCMNVSNTEFYPEDDTFIEEGPEEGLENPSASIASTLINESVEGNPHQKKFCSEKGFLRKSNLKKSLQNKKRIIKMLFVVVFEFFVCWTPLHVINTVSLFDPPAVYGTLGMAGVSALQLLAYCSACCNPITYCFMNATFRRAFVSAIRCKRENCPSQLTETHVLSCKMSTPLDKGSSRN